ncbi:hypothetical protein [Vibrio phage BUCT006]|nr:hypothetical protein [Vibrio phage BUCT006]
MKTKEQEIKEIENHINSLFKDLLKALLTLSSGVALGVLLSDAHAQDMAERLKNSDSQMFSSIVECVKAASNPCEAVNVEVYVANAN